MKEILAKQRLSVELVAANVSKRLDATTPVWTPTGSIEREDWQAQASATGHAIALLDRAGELPSPQAAPGSQIVTVNIVQFGRPQQVVGRQSDTDCEIIDVSNTKQLGQSDTPR